MTEHTIPARDAARIATLHPRLQPLAGAFLVRASALLEAHPELRTRRVIISQAFRSAADQSALFGQGRTAQELIAKGIDPKYAKPGMRRVTNAPPGRSLHESMLGGKPASRAFDIALLDGAGAAIWDSGLPEWSLLGAVGEGLGLTWGGRFKSIKDLPHFELHI